MVPPKILVTGIDASYYTVKDLDRATKFYTKLFGTNPTVTFPDMTCEWSFANGETFGLYKPPERESEFHASSGVMFAVADVASAVEASKAYGASFHGDVEDTPVCHMAFGMDTEGNGFILHRRK